MALPTTITGLSTTVATVGPFKSSGGNFYIIGVNSSDATKAQAQKASDPTSSFSAVGTDTVTGASQLYLAACQVSDTVHVLIAHGASSSRNYRYVAFDMSTDSWGTGEDAVTGVNVQTSAGVDALGCSIVVRSNGNAVLFYNGPRVASMGNSYAQTYYRERTGTNTYGTQTQVSAGGQVDCTQPEAILGASDRVHFIFRGSTGNQIRERSLSSANALDTEQGNTPANNGALPPQGISYDNSGTIKVIVGMGGASECFDSGANPTLVAGSIDGAGGIPRIFNDGTDAYALFRFSTDSDLYVSKSTDSGASWGTKASAFVGTVALADANLSKDGNIYQRGSDYVIPYVVNDNGTLKYNEYVVRTVASETLFATQMIWV
jgi:hypothetical protein